MSSPSLEPPISLFGERRTTLVAAGFFALATLAVFGDLLFFGGDRILSIESGDTATTFVEWYQFMVPQMRHGRLPLWNPHLYSGAPCLGGFQEALLYPPTWLHFFLPLPQAINWDIALHVFLAGLFTYLWVVHRRLHPAAGMVAGLMYMLGGGYFMHITPGHIPNLQTMVWPPLIFLAIDNLTMTRSLRGAWLGAGAVALQVLAGHPQYVYYTALIAGPYALVGLRRAPSRRTAATGLAVMCLGGAALSAVQLFTGIAAARESLRGNVSFDFARRFPLPPENLLTLVFPNFFGRATGSYWGRWYLWETSLFVGVTGFVLALYGLLAGPRNTRRWTSFAFFVAVTVVAFGYYTPLYPLLFRVLPGFASFRGISKVGFLATLFLAHLAAIGMDTLIRTAPLRRKAPLILLGAAIVLAGVGSFVWLSAAAGESGAWGIVLSLFRGETEAYVSRPVHRGPGASSAFQAAAHLSATDMFVAATICLVLAGIWVAGRRDRRIIYAAVAVLVVELVFFARQNCPTFHYASITQKEAGIRKVLRQLPPQARVMTGVPGIVLGAGGDDAWGDDPMVLARYARFMTLGENSSPRELLSRPVSAFMKTSPAWGFLRVGAILAPGEDGILQTTFVRGVPLSRAELIKRAQVIGDPDQALAALKDERFERHRRVLLDRPVDVPLPTSVGKEATEPGTVRIVEDPTGPTDEMEIEASVLRRCVLLISDNYADGWRVRPIGAAPQSRYEVVPADYTLRGIPLQPGSHHFVLEYRPAAFVAGKWVTVLALLVWIGMGGKLWIDRRRLGAAAQLPKTA